MHRLKATTVLLAGLTLAALPGQPVLAAKPQPAPDITTQRVAASLFSTPLTFEANEGQVDAQVKFLARGKGYTLFLTPTESVMVLQQREAREQVSDIHDPLAAMEPAPIKQSVVRMKLEEANPSPTIDGMEQLPGIVNYFIGNDPAKWRTKIPTYAKVQYKEAYPGIDLAYYGNHGKLEYDFIVAPGADPHQIKLAFEGASDIHVADSGDLVLKTALGDVRMQKPVVYQLEADGHKTLVAGSYIVRASSDLSPLASRPVSSRSVGIQLAAYDHSKPVVIDPVLDYATYLGGSFGDGNPDIAVDSSGSAYVAGWTNSLDFPVTGGAFDPTFNANPLCPGITVTNTTCLDPVFSTNINGDLFVAKLNPTGTALVYATYLGGTNFESSLPRITVDGAGQAYVVGGTRSPDFPVTPGAFQTTAHHSSPSCLPPSNCSSDGYVTKLDATGSSLVYSTYLGGNGGEGAMDVAVDHSGHAYVAWSGFPADFPTTPGAYDTTCGPAGVAKLNPTGTGLIWSTCLSTISPNYHEPWSIALDSVGNVILAGQAQGALISTANAAQPTYGGGGDAFVWKLNPTGSSLLFGTFLGGSGRERAFGVAVDSADNIYVTGQTDSPNFPTTPGAFDTSHNGGMDIFVTKYNPTGAIQYSTYLGGSSDECAICDIGVDSAGQAYISSETTSLNFPVLNAMDATFNGAADAVLVILKADGTGLVSSTFLGGTLQEFRVRLAVLPSGVAFLAGGTGSINFPVTSGVVQPARRGGYDDVFIARISNKPLANAGPDQSVPEGTLVTLDGTGSTGGSLTYIWTQVAGPTAALGGATTAYPTFSAPPVPAAGGTVTFELVVCEGTSSNCSDPDTVNVHITNVNQPPVAQAGPDQTVQEGSPVMLDGTASYDPDVDTLTYTWLQLFGPPVTLANPLTATPSFAAPAVGTGGGQVDFELIVTDPHGLNHADYVSVFITNVNQIPTANAGPDQTVNENALVTLNGSGSHDPDLDLLSYAWSQTSGPLVTLTGGATASPTFPAPEIGPGGAQLIFQLVVHDGHTSSAADTVVIAVQNVNDLPVCTAAKAKPKLLWPPNHKMVKVKIRGISQGTSRHDDDEEEDHQDGNDDHDGDDVQITITSVTQDEPINGLGDGDTSPDAAVSGNHVLLRAERAGNGNGRVYEVHFLAQKGQGPSCSGTVKVRVPRNKKDTAVDSGQLYNSFGP